MVFVQLMKAKLLWLEGGWNNGSLKSVEAYDYYENKWVYLPDMTAKRHVHASVSRGNKLFVIGGYEKSTCEVFDSCSRNFCYLKTCTNFNNMSVFQAVCVSNQLKFFGDVSKKYETKVFSYNIETNESKVICCGYLKNKCGVSCIKYHQ